MNSFALARGWLVLGAMIALLAATTAGGQPKPGPPAIPDTWDPARLAGLDVPLADPAASPKHVSKEYYDSVPVRSIYRSYDVYHPGKEPPGYRDWLAKQEPEVVWGADKAPPLATDEDWIKAGEIVFDSANGWSNGSIAGPYAGISVQDPKWYDETHAPLTPDGKLPFYRYVIRTKGKVEVGVLSCAVCHTRVMPDGTVVKGAQGNFPFGKAFAYDYRHNNQEGPARALERLLYGAPWLHPDPLAELGKKTVEDIAAAHAVVPPGVLSRHGTGVWSPVTVPDLIGIKDRKYLDRTGLIRHRDTGDLMRYAALNQRFDDLARHGDFRPVGAVNAGWRENPPHPRFIDRYSDVQLFALAKYVYALTPPKPKEPADAGLVEAGRTVFAEQRCARCHEPPAYTNNKLTRAPGFAVPDTHPDRDAVMREVVGTDPTLTLATRRGTGFYKVPSLKGVWYRGPFEHNGSCATLEDWFDPNRLKDTYVPTGWKGPPGTTTRAVKGHEYGLDLSADERKALIAFLKTL